MSEQANHKGRIPFESLNDDDQVSSWSLPSMDSAGQAAKATKKNKQTSSEKIETLKNNKPKPLNADELQKITEQARQEGFHQGLKEGTEQGIREGTKIGEKTGEQKAYTEARKDIEALQQRLSALCEQLYDPVNDQMDWLENCVVDMGLQLARRLVGAEIQARPELLHAIVQRALEALPSVSKGTRVYLNANDAQLIEQLSKDREWTTSIDDTLADGGCRIETQHANVDFSVEHRLQAYLTKVDVLKDSALPDLDELPDYRSAEDSPLIDGESTQAASSDTADDDN